MTNSQSFGSTPDTLAMYGGEPAVDDSLHRPWPITEQSDINAVTSVLASGVLVSDRPSEKTAVEALEEEWAHYLGVPHCIAVSNGTTAIEIALLAEGVKPGDDVIVPALSFVATAMAVVHVGANPVYVDINRDSFNIDANEIEANATPNTTAILPVHLHGLPAAMDTIEEIAKRRGWAIIEDAAQAHGARDSSGILVGARGNTTAFSLQMTKNLPTCGEGGLIVTTSAEVAQQARLLRQFGERLRKGKPRRYVSYQVGFNAKLSNVQAAYTSSQLQRFASYHSARRHNIRSLLSLVSDLPGLTAPSEPVDVEHAWHILRFCLDPKALTSQPVDGDELRTVVMSALRAEGVPVSRYQILPLPEQPALKARTNQSAEAWKVTAEVVRTSFTLQQRHLRPDAGLLLEQYARAFEKVFSNIGTLWARRSEECK